MVVVWNAAVVVVVDDDWSLAVFWNVVVVVDDGWSVVVGGVVRSKIAGNSVRGLCSFTIAVRSRNICSSGRTGKTRCDTGNLK